MSSKNHSSKSITIDMDLIRVFGAEASVLMGRMLSLSESYDNCFVYTHEQIENDLGIKPYTAKRVINSLVDKGIILIQKKGVPCKYHYSFNIDTLNLYLGG